jgi:hypothetical protein
MASIGLLKAGVQMIDDWDKPLKPLTSEELLVRREVAEFKNKLYADVHCRKLFREALLELLEAKEKRGCSLSPVLIHIG